MPPGAGTAPFESAFPQSGHNCQPNVFEWHKRDSLQHSSAYSTPAKVYPALLHAEIQSATVLDVDPPVTVTPVVSARPLVPSLRSSHFHAHQIDATTAQSLS